MCLALLRHDVVYTMQICNKAFKISYAFFYLRGKIHLLNVIDGILCVHAVYLFFGLVLMLLLVANVYDVPELNLGRYFYLSADNSGDDAGERQHLHSPSDDRQPTRYTTSDPSKAEHDVGSGGGGTKPSKKPEDKKRLTDDAM